jgi:hypothetical protein
MADVSKLKRRRLGTPPPDDIGTNFNSPEIAPATPVATAPHSQDTATGEIPVKRDGRSARKTNRTLAFATRVTPDFDREARNIAEHEGILLVEVLERALQAYKDKMSY